jgi:hypothetical protein
VKGGTISAVCKLCSAEPSIYFLVSVSVYVCMHVSIYLWFYSPLLRLGRFFSFLNFYTGGRTPWTRDQPVARPLPAQRTARTQNKHTRTSMSQVGFETMIPAFERVKTVYVIDCAAAVISVIQYTPSKLILLNPSLLFPPNYSVSFACDHFRYCKERSASPWVNNMPWRRMEEWIYVEFYGYLTAGLDEIEWWASRSYRPLPSREIPRYQSDAVGNKISIARFDKIISIPRWSRLVSMRNETLCMLSLSVIFPIQF